MMESILVLILILIVVFFAKVDLFQGKNKDFKHLLKFTLPDFTKPLKINVLYIFSQYVVNY